MKKSRHIYITRSLSDDSPFQSLKTEGWHIIDQSLVDITHLEIDEIHDCDLYFYYSRNCIIHAWKNAERLQYPLQDKLHACIGMQTAQYLKSKGCRRVVYIGNSNGNLIAQDLDRYFEGKKIGFFSARNSLRSVEKHLKSAMAQNIAVYDNIAVTEQIASNIDYLVATSPMNARAFFQNYTGDLNGVICIGNTTYKAVQKIYNGEIKKSAQTNEESMLQSLRSLIGK